MAAEKAPDGPAIRRQAKGRAAQLGMAQRSCRETVRLCRDILKEECGPSDIEVLVHAARVEMAMDVLKILEPCP